MSMTSASSFQANKKAVGSLKHNFTADVSSRENSNRNLWKKMLYNHNKHSSMLSKIPNLRSPCSFNGQQHSTLSENSSPLNYGKFPKHPGNRKLIGSSNMLNKLESITTRSFIGDGSITNSKKSGQQSRNNG